MKEKFRNLVTRVATRYAAISTRFPMIHRRSLRTLNTLTREIEDLRSRMDAQQDAGVDHSRTYRQLMLKIEDRRKIVRFLNEDLDLDIDPVHFD